VLRDLAKDHPQISLRTSVRGAEDALTIRIRLVASTPTPLALDEVLERADADLRARLGIEMHERPTDAGRMGD